MKDIRQFSTERILALGAAKIEISLKTAALLVLASIGCAALTGGAVLLALLLPFAFDGVMGLAKIIALPVFIALTLCWMMLLYPKFMPPKRQLKVPV